MRIKYDKELLDYINIFQNTTHARAKDCFKLDDTLYFIVEKGDMGKAIGKQGSHVKKLEHAFNKNIKIIEFDEKIESFIQNILYPFKPEQIKAEEEKVIIRSEDRQLKGKIIGRSSSNLERIKKIIKRFFPVEEIVVE